MQLTLFLQKNAEEERVIHLRNNNIKIASYNDANYVVDELLESLRSKYQGNLEISMRRSGFIFDSAQLIYYKCHKVNFKLVGSYIDSPDWINKKKKTINLKNTDDKCF